MIRTITCVLFAAAAAGLVSHGGAVASGQKKDDPQPKTQPVGGQMVTPFMECAKACDDCARVCDDCGAHCAKLAIEGSKHHQTTMRTCQDCAEVCSAASRIMARQGPFSDTICIACAQACKRCGDECEKHGANDPVMKRCAEECRRCEKACLTFLKNAGFAPDGPPKK